MPLDVGGLGKETGWISKWAMMVDALAADAIGRQAIADGYFAATAEMRAKFADGLITAAKLAQPTAEGILGAGFRVCRATYNFAVDGGVVGTIPLLGATSIPANAVILDGFLNVTTGLTSAGAATAALGVEAANDIKLVLVVSNTYWTHVGRKIINPSMQGGSTILTTAARDVSLVIGVADLTAGAFDVYLFYILIA